MKFKTVDGIKVWGDPLQNAVDQMKMCIESSGAVDGVLMADHHLGYAVPVGGVVVYKDKISPSGVGFDIACGNMAIRTNIKYDGVKDTLPLIMDRIFANISFGVGRKNQEDVDHELFYDDPAWGIDVVREHRELARAQLGTVGSGNHYVDLFVDDKQWIWVGVHFGSRGLGHKIASHYIKEAGGIDGINVPTVTLDVNSGLGKEYIAAMNLAGRYAYAGREWVVGKVCAILSDIVGVYVGAESVIHNHHNFAWNETHGNEDFWVVRKGATPAFPDQYGFIGASMGEDAVIIQGVDSHDSKMAWRSTVHGAGRVLSRTQAAGKSKWKKGVRTKTSEGLVSQAMMDAWVAKSGVILRGAGVDESPHCYKRLPDVLDAHSESIKIVTTLRPIGVCMAGNDIIDPYKD